MRGAGTWTVILMRIALLLLMTILLPGAMYADELSLVLSMADGTQKVIKVSDTPVIRFEENLLVMESQNMSTSIPLDKVSGYTFSKSVVDGVADPDSDAETWVERRGDQLLFFPSDRGYEITVTGIDGKTLQVHKVDAGMSYTLTLDDLTSGIYLISTNNHTLKVAKK